MAARPELIVSFDLDADLAKRRRQGYFSLGFSDVLARAGELGFSNLLEDQAARVGAQAVLFCIWPAKLKAVARLSNGEIDLEALAADQPSSFSSKSYAVTRAFFLARSSKGKVDV
ncbi:MAG TPA: hypothetical protein VFE23_00010 [Usitatibacter sp.]|jgi:hypothetical protein|nr:hypothetical protein [Usitatibacter sp.]